MAYGIPGFDITVTRNGSPVRVKSGSVTREARKLGAAWELTLVEPMNISADDTWTIIRSWAGYDQVLIDEAVATNIGGEDGLGVASRRISGTAETSGAEEILEYCVPKTMVFFNPDWLTFACPGGRLEDGIIKTAPITAAGYGFTIPGGRFYHDRLPGKEFADTDFVCIEARSHHDIARKLAAMVGFNVVVNTPDVLLIDTYTVPSGTIWFSAIKANFEALWSPNVWITEDKIYVADILGDDSSVQPLQTITVGNAAIVSTSTSLDTKKQPEVDHLIITGRNSKNTTTSYEDPDFTPIKLPEVPLTIDTTITANVDYGDIESLLQMEDSYNGAWCDPAFTPSNMKSSENEQKYHVRRDPVRGDQWILVEETTSNYDKDGLFAGKTTVEHKYSKDFKPVRTIETEWNYCENPGTVTKTLRKTKIKTTMQDQFVKALNLSLTREVEEQLVYYDEATKSDGSTYKDSPVPFHVAKGSDFSRDFIETDSATTQGVVSMPVRWKQSFISRAHDDYLIKRDIEFNVLQKEYKIQSSLLQNPKKNPQPQSTDALFRREYFDGTGHVIGGYTCFHPPKTVSHPDITTDTLAEQIRDRVFARRNITDNQEIVVKTPIPIPIETTAILITLPSFSQDVNGVTVTVAGGNYNLKAIRDAFSFEGDENFQEIKSEQTLTVKVKL